jgi:two-component system chemotaxis response regulator CheB
MRPPGLLLIAAECEARQSIEVFLAALPADFPPAVIVSHQRDPGGGDEFAAALSRALGRRVEEPEDKDDILSGHIYLSPPGYHLLLDEDSFCLSREPPIAEQRPAAAPLLESAADTWSRRVRVVLLAREVSAETAQALRHLESHGGAVSIVAPGMETAVAASEMERSPATWATANAWIAEMSLLHRVEGRP